MTGFALAILTLWCIIVTICLFRQKNKMHSMIEMSEITSTISHMERYLAEYPEMTYILNQVWKSMYKQNDSALTIRSEIEKLKGKTK